MQRRQFIQAVGAAPTAALATQTALAGDDNALATSSIPAEPTVLLYDDGRHAAPIYQYAPPLRPQDFLVTVDQLIGSGADTLVYFSGLEGGIAIYDSQVSQKWGDNVDKWKHPVWYRGARHLKQLIDAGHDPLKLLCDRCHEKGLWFIAADYIGLQGSDREKDAGYGRKSDFVYNHPEFSVGHDPDPRAKDIDPKRFSFLHPALREERMRVYSELLRRYETDGVEVNLAEFVPFCKFQEVDQLAEILTAWLRDLRREAQHAEQEQGRRKRVYVRIPAHPDAWKMLGYQVSKWIDEELIDAMVCLPGLMESILEQDADLSAAVERTRNSTCRVIAGMSPVVGREFNLNASQAMTWAAAANAYRQGVSGFAVVTYCWLPNGWPWVPEDYQTLRPLGHPDLLTHVNKHYHVRSEPDGSVGGAAFDEWLPGMARSLPQRLNEGHPITVRFSITDDLAAAAGEGKLDSIELRVRLTNVEPSLNDLRVELNGKVLPDKLLRLYDLTYRRHKTGGMGPYGYIYEYRLEAPYFPTPGSNELIVTLTKDDPLLDAAIDLHDVDCLIHYRVHRDFDAAVSNI